MLVSLFCALFAAQAQTLVTDLSQLDNGNTYTLRSKRAFLLYSSAVSGEICSSNGNSVGSVSYNASDENQQFRIEKEGSNYYLYSVGAGKYVGTDGKYTSSASVAMKIENVGGDYPWKLQIGNQGMNTQIKGQTASGIMVNSWTTTDEGNRFQIAEAVVKAKTYTIDVLGAENGGVTYEGQTYADGETFEAKNLKKKVIRAYPFDGWYSVISSMESYFESSMALLRSEARNDLFRNADRRIYTKIRNSAPTKYSDGAKVKNSLLADGCVIEGTVENCILFRNVHVGKGTVIKNCILLQDTYVGDNVQLNCVVTDKNVVIKDGRMLSGHETKPFFIGKGEMV